MIEWDSIYIYMCICLSLSLSLFLAFGGPLKMIRYQFGHAAIRAGESRPVSLVGALVQESPYIWGLPKIRGTFQGNIETYRI